MHIKLIFFFNVKSLREIYYLYRHEREHVYKRILLYYILSPRANYFILIGFTAMFIKR